MLETNEKSHMEIQISKKAKTIDLITLIKIYSDFITTIVHAYDAGCSLAENPKVILIFFCKLSM